MEFKHIPVLLKECLEGLDIKEDGTYLDATIGGGGHSYEIIKRLGTGLLVGMDQDEEALKAAAEKLSPYKDKLILIHNNFSNMDQSLKDIGIEKLDGVLMDIGVSSYQLDNPERGFSYHEEGLLDMRMNCNAEVPTAADIVNNYSQEDLTDIFYKYGEERWSKRIAEFIVDRRRTKKLETSFDLVEVIKKAIPKKVRMQDKHPARRVFQALRIEVNGELDRLESGLRQAVDHLKPTGRLCVISFHSLEDRIVKNTFKEMATDCICPPGLPVCSCNHKKEVLLINKRPICAMEEELALNPRARSAKLRIVEKI